ncbi:MAG TPA: hypothetical protein VM432_07550, partial [Bdellovibrionales bacterium]|nr:hypothetical protein [Bdellovibrionales bacterium]
SIIDGKIATIDRKKPEGESIHRVSWFPDSKSFVYDSMSTFDRYYYFSDIWRYDIEAKKKKRLTKGLRAREPMVSPDGKRIVFVQSTPGSTRLAMAKSDGSQDRVLYTPPLQTRIASPDFLPDGRIIFSERRDDGVEVLRTISIEKGAEPQTVLREFAPAHFPRVTKQGLIFTSEKSGVSNIYLASADLQQARALTNTLTQATAGDIDPITGDLIFSRLDSDGPAIYTVKKPDLDHSATPPKIEPLIAYDWPKFEKPKVEFASEESDYSALGYLFPRYWMPWITFAPDGVSIQASTSASDPLGKHAYAIAAGYDAWIQRPNYIAEYTNHQTHVPILIYGQDVNEFVYNENVINDTGIRHTTAAGAIASFFIPGLGEEFRGGIGWKYNQIDVEEFIDDRPLVVRQGPTASIGWADLSQRGLEISPEDGGTASIAHTRFLKDYGSLTYEQTDVSLSKYLSGFVLPERHVVAAYANASIAPNLQDPLLGKTTTSTSYSLSLVQTAFPMRGYLSGTFIGNNVVTGTLEYRFPIAYNYRGFGTAPFFLRRIHAALFGDGISLDGLVYERELGRYRPEKLGRVYFGTGGELKFDVTAFYFVPLTISAGLYYGTDPKANPDGLLPFIGFGL